MNADTAQLIATAAHAGQTDQSGHDYITHPARVARRVADVLGSSHPAVAVAWLHDVLEDTNTSAEQLTSAGATTEQLTAVLALTHAPNEPHRDYLARVASSELALVVKLADIADNSDLHRLAALDGPTRTRLTAKYERALRVLAELTGVADLRYDSPALVTRLQR